MVDEQVTDQPEPSDSILLTTPRVNPAGRGWGWIKDGFGYFKKQPLPWIAALIIGLLIIIVLGFIPLLGQLALMLTTYIWLAGFMIGCEAQSRGEPFEIRHLFAGFSNNAGRLVMLSLIYTIITVGFMLIVMGPLFMGMMESGFQPDPETMASMFDPVSFLLRLLITLLFMVPLLMAVWFAPALIVLNDVPVIAAMKLSFNGCLKNMLAFLVYGLIALLLYFLAVIPFLLGLLVLFPTLIASIHVAYKDIFIE
jgi:hypothetical protein